MITEDMPMDLNNNDSLSEISKNIEIIITELEGKPELENTTQQLKDILIKIENIIAENKNLNDNKENIDMNIRNNDPQSNPLLNNIPEYKIICFDSHNALLKIISLKICSLFIISSLLFRLPPLYKIICISLCNISV